ncbi:MAG: hypothetical protein ACC742_02760 [Thermoanaerobaculales bacterium]
MVVAGPGALTAALAIVLAVTLAACAARPKARSVPVPDAVLEIVPIDQWPSSGPGFAGFAR